MDIVPQGRMLLDEEGFPVISIESNRHEEVYHEYPVIRGSRIDPDREDSESSLDNQKLERVPGPFDERIRSFGYVRTEADNELITVFHRGRLIQVDREEIQILYEEYLKTTAVRSRVPVPKRKRKRSENKKVVKITGWEEYLYGRNVFEQKKEYCLLNCSSGFFRRIANLIPRQLVDVIVYLICLKMFFVVFISYDMFWKLYCFCMQAEHVRIHDTADERGIDIEFVGSFFQAPYCAFMKEIWCAHCAHKRTENTCRKLLNRYRKENEYLKHEHGSTRPKKEKAKSMTVARLLMRASNQRSKFNQVSLS